MFEQATLLIEERLTTEWVTTPIDFDNVPYKPVPGQAFVRLQIDWVGADVVSVGGRIRGTGYVYLSIYVPTGAGIREAAAMADSLAAIFNGYTTTYLQFMVGYPERIGQQEEFFAHKLIIPFNYDFC